MAREPSENEQRLERRKKEMETAQEQGDARKIQKLRDEMIVIKRLIKKENEQILPHRSLQFGPVWQTVALMAALSLGMSVAPLPLETLAFYYLFSRITIVAVISLVVHSSIIYYGYNRALEKMPKPPSPEEKFRQMRQRKPERPDLWAHTRSHPSQFLTTQHAAPRLFPFPLGKAKPAAAVAQELWWEGGNAPHVGHFNKPKLPEPEAPMEEVLLERYKESKALEDQRKLWKKRIRTIQYICVVIIISYLNRKVAIAALCWLIYNTASTELNNMLKPPADMERVYSKIDEVIYSAGRTSSSVKPGRGQPTSGMSYIYDPAEAKSLNPNRNVAIPLHVVPPHVLMTTQNYHLAGPGEQIKDPNK